MQPQDLLAIIAASFFFQLILLLTKKKKKKNKKKNTLIRIENNIDLVRSFNIYVRIIQAYNNN